MDAEEVRTCLQQLLKDTPLPSVNDLQGETSELTSLTSGSISTHTTPGFPAAQDNQTLLEKIFWKVYNYRLFRFFVSVIVYSFHPSKLTTMRMLTWAIKVLRITNLGILLGFIDTTPQQPTQPVIIFEQDLANRTLTVTSAYPDDVLWTDIDQIGSGHCDPLPTGNVTIGDTLTNCTGVIVLRYIPLNLVLGVFQFT